MKKVFTNSEIVHKFNELTQNEARTPTNSMFFNSNGKKLYSYGYHYLLAEFIDENTVLINDKGYSVTTSRHISLVAMATRNRKQFFWSTTNCENVNRTIKECLNKLPRATILKEHYQSTIISAYDSYKEYLTYTKQLTKSKKIKEHREIERVILAFKNNYENLENTIKQELKNKAIKEKKRISKLLKDWKSNKIDWFRNGTNFDYLRINGENVETSQNVKIPITEAKRVLKLIEAKNVLGAKIDNRFRVFSFNKFLKVGCHNISIKEINYIKNVIK
jgi:hypothetical protein